MFLFSDPITKIPGIKKYYAGRLQNLGIRTVEDLLYHFPHRYDDFTQFKKIASLQEGESVTTRGKIAGIETSRTWKKRMSVTEALVEDETGTIKAVWFNNPLPVKFLSRGKYIQLSGKVIQDKQGALHFQHPNFELISKDQLEQSAASPDNSDLGDTSTGKLIPVYSQTQGLTSYWLRRVIKKVLSRTKIVEFIPEDVLSGQKLIGLKQALHNVHFPRSSAESQTARKRFAFEKMFLLQIKALQAKKNWESNTATSISFDEKFIKSFVSSLPFRLTDAQKKAAWQIIKDLEKTRPMNRLMEGDVGSGKTVVAAMAVLSTAKAGSQVALLAPTEVLATQHYASLLGLLKGRSCKIGLLTAANCKTNGKDCAKKKLKEEVATGSLDLVIGTHALLQKDVFFQNLALVIIDEQHRFGVNQRARLQQQALAIDDGKPKTVPHLLTMTATPIPRTLSLALFGNLDLSIIDEHPKGRKNIITKTIPLKGRDQVYQFIKNEIASGRQAFIIYPLVEESSKMSEIKAATEEHQRLAKKVFPEFSLGLMHGRIKAKEKEAVMEDFKNKKYDILVSTSVVEVGVDVPNATIMIIEGAERFGLSQLHQFRGRVGRGSHQSYCFLFTSDNAPESTRRLNVLSSTNDGFKISQEDMKLRGPGQFLGTLQSGTPDIAMESLTDVKSIQAARTEAQRVLEFDAKLDKFPLLKKQMTKLESLVHWE